MEEYMENAREFRKSDVKTAHDRVSSHKKRNALLRKKNVDIIPRKRNEAFEKEVARKREAIDLGHIIRKNNKREENR